jgi:transcriptional regulator with XRE-family HTH domain
MSKQYKSYLFVDKDPVIDKLRTMVERSGLTYTQTADMSGVAVSTIYNWFHGATKRPQFATVIAVVRSLGHDVTFIKSGFKKTNVIAISKKRVV